MLTVPGARAATGGVPLVVEEPVALVLLQAPLAPPAGGRGVVGVRGGLVGPGLVQVELDASQGGRFLFGAG